MRVHLAALLAALALPLSAGAQPGPGRTPPAGARPADPGPGASGLTLALRLGWATPRGDISDEGDPPLDDLADHKVPFWIELGYRFTPAVWGAMYLELAPLAVNDAYCPEGRSCEGRSVRFGIGVQLHLAPGAVIDPWLGVGLGAEFVSAEAFDEPVGDVSTFGFGGVELPLLEGGIDLALSPRFTLGPYLAWSVGQFTSWSVERTGSADGSGRIVDRAGHAWVQLGVKGTFKL